MITYYPNCPQHVILGHLDSLKLPEEPSWECGRVILPGGDRHTGRVLLPQQITWTKNLFPSDPPKPGIRLWNWGWNVLPTHTHRN